MATWPRQAELAGEALLHAKQAARSTGEEGVAAPLRYQPTQDAFDAGRSARALGIGYRDDLRALAPEQVDGDQKLGPPRAEDSGDGDAVVACGSGERSKRCETSAAADRNDAAKARIEREADAERTHDVETIPGRSVASPRVPDPVTLYRNSI